jgi:hypothetical protein
MAQAERCLATGNATRVGSIIAVFFERLGNQQDAFPAIQGVEASWRELGGLPEERKLRREILSAIASLESRAKESGLPYGAAVSCALAAARVLVTEWNASRPQFSRVAAESLSVALEFDRFGITPPTDNGSWVEFELNGESSLAAHVFREPGLLGTNELFNIRIAAGSGSMSYSNALKIWMSA